MYRFCTTLYVDDMLRDIRDLRSRLDELRVLQIALGNDDLPWLAPRHKSAVLDLVACVRGFSDRSELDDLLLLGVRQTVCIGQMNEALNCLEAVLIPRRTYR